MSPSVYLHNSRSRRGSLPPDFLAPNLFPGPSLALLTDPCALCDACRTNVKTGEGVLMDSCAKASFRHAG